MLPLSLRAVYALNAATFQVSSLALLSIVNTRVGIPAEYLPAYGAISFLPYSLRPIFAWVSSLLLSRKQKCSSSDDDADDNDSTTTTTTTTTEDEGKNRHDKLLFPAYLLASLALVGTTFIPPGGVVACFFFGFARGIAGAWSDFLIGMSVIEFSRLQSRFLPSLSPTPPGDDECDDECGGGNNRYEQIVSVNTAQSATAKNLGSFVAAIGTFFFFARNRDLGDRVANTLILGTAAIFLAASLASLKYQFHVGKLIANFGRYDTIDDHDEEIIRDVAVVELSQSGVNRTERVGGTDDAQEGVVVPPTNDSSPNEDASAEKGARHWQQIAEVSTLVSFQTLLAVSALRKPVIAVSNQTAWASIMAIAGVALVVAICLGYRLEKEDAAAAAAAAASSSPSLREGEYSDVPLARRRRRRLPHRQLNLYFLLRYSMPIAGFLMYSYLYTVFESEPQFLQLLSVMKSAIGSLSTFFYEKFLSAHCHSGWPLIGLIASLDIMTGLVALLDVWVVRAVKEKEIDGEYTIDTSLRCLVAAVGLTKYFFAELDYMPAQVLSTTNVCSDDDMRSNDGKRAPPTADNDTGAQADGSNAQIHDFERSDGSSSDAEFGNEGGMHPRKKEMPPAISAGMQYASFLSCIDFGAQIGDWISVPIIASLGITRENHWDHLDRFVVLCCVFRMARVVFLWLICPPIHFHRIKS